MEPSFLRSRNDDFNFIALLIVIIMGVTIGNLLSNWISAKYVEYQMRVAAHDANKALKQHLQQSNAAVEQANERAAQQNAEHRAEQQLQRADDSTGKRLGRICHEWRVADSNLKSYTTGVEMSKHCMRHEIYVRDGVVIQP